MQWIPLKIQEPSEHVRIRSPIGQVANPRNLSSGTRAISVCSRSGRINGQSRTHGSRREPQRFLAGYGELRSDERATRACSVRVPMDRRKETDAAREVAVKIKKARRLAAKTVQGTGGNEEEEEKEQRNGVGVAPRDG